MGCINFLGSLDVIIGLTGLVIQIITIADPNGEVLPNKSFPSDFNEHYGVGIWSGILFILAGIASFRFSTLLKYDINKTIWKVVLIVMAVLAMACGIALIIIAGVNLDNFTQLGDCLADFTKCSCEQYFNGNFCGTQKIYNTIFISVGIAALVVNPILILLALCNCG